jgi:hypothetical protein
MRKGRIGGPARRDPRKLDKVVVVAREDEDAAMLNHAFIQSRRRYRT